MTTDIIVFDVEGTLIDCVPHVLESWHHTLAEGGHRVLRSDLQYCSGMDGKDMLDRLLPHVLSSEKKRLLKAQGERYRKAYMSLAKPFPRVADLIRRLKDQQRVLGVATTCKDDELKAYDQSMGVLRFMDAVACGDDASKGKPHPDLFYEVLKKLEVTEPHRVLVVGDTPYDALAAKPLGLRVAGLLTGGFSSEDLKAAGCDVVLAEIKDLEGVSLGSQRLAFSLLTRREPGVAKAGADSEHPPALVCA
jgi:HAD superfamily hydrolase (TIGR01509 family)